MAHRLVDLRIPTTPRGSIGEYDLARSPSRRVQFSLT